MLVIATFHPSKVTHQIPRTSSLFEPEQDPDDDDLYSQWPNQELKKAMEKEAELDKQGIRLPVNPPRKSTAKHNPFGSPVADPKFMIYDTLTKTAQERKNDGKDDGFSECENIIPFRSRSENGSKSDDDIHDDDDETRDSNVTKATIHNIEEGSTGAEAQHKALATSTLGWFDNIFLNLILS